MDSTIDKLEYNLDNLAEIKHGSKAWNEYVLLVVMSIQLFDKT